MDGTIPTKIITGTVEAANASERGIGLKIRGDWYNSVPETEKYCAKFQKDDWVSITFLERVSNGKTYRNIMFIKPAEQEPETRSDVKEEKIGQKKVEGVKIGMCVNNAAAYIQAKCEEKLPPAKWAAAVVEYADALLEEMHQKGLL